MKLRRRRRVKAFPQKRSQLGGSGLLPGIWAQGFARPVRLAGQRLRRRPDKCDAGRRRPSGRRILRPAASGRTRSLRCAAPALALCGLNIPAAGTHATPAPNRAHSGSHAETRRVLRVDGDDVFGSGIIDTIGPFQADQTVPIALAECHRNTAPP